MSGQWRVTDFKMSGAPPLETPPEVLEQLRNEREDQTPDEQAIDEGEQP